MIISLFIQPQNKMSMRIGARRVRRNGIFRMHFFVRRNEIPSLTRTVPEPCSTLPYARGSKHPLITMGDLKIIENPGDKKIMMF